MKRNTPYQILLAVTLLTTGFTLAYTFLLRESFGVTIGYDFPRVTSAESAQQTISSAGEFDEPEDAEAWETAPPPEISIPEEAAGRTEGLPVQEPPSAAAAEVYGEFYEEPEPDEIVVEFPLDLNGASYEELLLVPRIGDVTAQRILQYKEVLGGYTELEQLMEISGIGEKTFEEMAPYLIIE